MQLGILVKTDKFHYMILYKLYDILSWDLLHFYIGIFYIRHVVIIVSYSNKSNKPQCLWFSIDLFTASFTILFCCHHKSNSEEINDCRERFFRWRKNVFQNKKHYLFSNIIQGVCESKRTTSKMENILVVFYCVNVYKNYSIQA